ncbi:MAG: XRE family transcriptional regulator [Clostridia bacterium]|nr:XRE family transcriptional regulator [Clostridia bacterium]
MKITTGQLLEELKNTSDLQAFFERHEKDFSKQTSAEYLNDLLAIKQISVAKVVKKSGAGEYLYKIFGGERKASRDVLIAMAFGMGLSLEETQLLLRISKIAVLDVRDKRDGVIIYGISHGWTVFETDDALDRENLTTIL